MCWKTADGWPTTNQAPQVESQQAWIPRCRSSCCLTHRSFRGGCKLNQVNEPRHEPWPNRGNLGQLVINEGATDLSRYSSSSAITFSTTLFFPPSSNSTFCPF